MNELLGLIIGLGLTLGIYSYIWGDNAFYRLTVHILVGVSGAYAAVVVIEKFFLPVLNQLRNDPTDLSNLLWGVPLFLSLLLLLKLFRPVASLGNIAMAAIIGSGASVALVGAISGTLLPQLIAKASPNGFLSFLAALFTICTLLYFQFTGRANNSGQMLQPIWHRYLASIGRGVLMVTFGALFALTLATSLALLTERFFYFINQVSNLLS